MRTLWGLKIDGDVTELWGTSGIHSRAFVFYPPQWCWFVSTQWTIHPVSYRWHDWLNRRRWTAECIEHNSSVQHLNKLLIIQIQANHILFIFAWETTQFILIPTVMIDEIEIKEASDRIIMLWGLEKLVFIVTYEQ